MNVPVADSTTVAIQLARDIHAAVLPLPGVNPFCDRLPAQKLVLAP